MALIILLLILATVIVLYAETYRNNEIYRDLWQKAEGKLKTANETTIPTLYAEIDVLREEIVKESKDRTDIITQHLYEKQHWDENRRQAILMLGGKFNANDCS